MSYPSVNIVNSTRYVVYGTVSYRTVFCRDDNFRLGPHEPWTAPGERGFCLVIGIAATVETPGGPVKATPYTSGLGTTYSQFALIQISANPLAFELTRRVSSGVSEAAEDVRPADYVEPTTQQKD
jgi:hypothetical protein